MRITTISIFCILFSLITEAQTYKFDFTDSKKVKSGYIKIGENDTFSVNNKYGFDLLKSIKVNDVEPFFFSIALPDGNYHITAIIGGKKRKAETSIRGESRRLFFENIETKKGELKKCSFVINKRNRHISEKENVNIKPRENKKLNWDDKLTLEFNGDSPLLSELIVERVDSVPTIFLCGNSTVVDQDNEPWASWGQMITRFFNDSICFANYAESGESANTFIAAGRLKKALTQMKKGDYIFMEFGHNDQKQSGPGKGAYYSFMTSLKIFIDEAKLKGAYPILVTPTQRRSFDKNGKIMDTHKDFPEAIRFLAEKENIPLIDLHQMTRTLYEALGEENSKKAFVHYSAGSYPGQTSELADNTHFNPYGAYQISKCVIEGMKKANLPIIKYLREDYNEYNPAYPDEIAKFRWNNSPFTEIEKPDGN